MSDIVERLRSPLNWLRNGPFDVYSSNFTGERIANEAAEEIERLRERVADLQAESGYMESIAAIRDQRR